jgi:hydrogenase maturation protein HypF
METIIGRGFNSPQTSSVGRLFDAVASLAGIRDRVSFEGQAAIQLEQLATETDPDSHYPFVIETAAAQSKRPAVSFPAPLGWIPEGQTDVIDTRPLIRAVAEDVRQGVETRRIARRFHTTVVEIICQMCGKIRQVTKLQAVALSGGVFMNGLVAREAAQRLRLAGFRVYRHRLVPPNDGGLSLGQLAVAVAFLSPHANSSADEQNRAVGSDAGSLRSPEISRGTNECASPSPAGSLKRTKSTTS